MSIGDLAKIFGESEHKAGIHQIIDPEAIKVLKRKPLKIIVVNGFKPENMLAAIEGRDIGTVIQ
jgi:uridylate kinase